MAHANSVASANALDAAGLIGVRLIVSGVVWASGFRAISDDDYARVVIAQNFAHAPSLDPSGTSWLPFPFWLCGSAMLLFGRQLTTAVAVAWLSGVASTLLVWTAARWIGLSRWSAFLAALLASLFPYSAWLGVATVPETLTAGLVVISAASLSNTDPSRRVWGSLCICLATLSRYETWPVAALFALFCIWDAFRQPVLHSREAPLNAPPSRARRTWLMSAALSISGIAGWMVHGVFSHGSATFFVRRVSDYQHALGGHDFDAWTALTRHPKLLFAEPELMALATVGLALWLPLLRRTSAKTGAEPEEQSTRPARALVRPLLLCSGLLVFLIAGDLRGAGATHHSARVLLPVWMLGALLVMATVPPTLCRWLARGSLSFPNWAGNAARALPVVAVAIGSAARLHRTSPNQTFVDRSEELALGHRAREVAAAGRLLVDSKDYGYFAMIAAFSAPERADTVDSLDPREKRKTDPFQDPHALGARLKQQQVLALVAPLEKQSATEPLGHVVVQTSQYVLIAVHPTRN